MENDKLIGVVVEREWYKNIVEFMQKSYQVDDKTMTVIVNGCKPTITEEDKNNILAQFGIMTPEEKVEGAPANDEAKKVSKGA